MCYSLIIIHCMYKKLFVRIFYIELYWNSFIKFLVLLKTVYTIYNFWFIVSISLQQLRYKYYSRIFT